MGMRFLSSPEAGAILQQQLFDAATYQKIYDLGGISADQALLHYFFIGERLGFRPNAFFDPRHYSSQLSIADRSLSVTLLGHYAQYASLDGPEPSREFDARWYAWEYMNGSSEPPLGHFMTYGLMAGYQPGPNKDLDSWLIARSAGRNEACALVLEALEAGEPLELSAQDWEADLRAAQVRFRSDIELHVLRRSEPRRRNLVLVQSGRRARLEWLTPNRNFDVLRNYYEDPGSEFCQESDHVTFQRGTKTTAVSILLKKYPDILLIYNYILLLDDDVDISTSSIEHLFDEMSAHHLVLAQPLLSHDSQTVWRALRDPGNRGRIVPVTSVEVMMPAFSREALRALAWTFDESVSGFGIDLLWGSCLSEEQKQGQIAVVGSVSARHLRPIDEVGGAFYRAMAARGISPRLELWRLMTRHGLKAELRPLDAPAGSGKPGPTNMRITVVSMIRNEAGILPAFLAHVGAIFDRILIIDQNSSDGSLDILEAASVYLPLSVWSLNTKAYQQSAVLTGLTNRAFSEGADWVFILDADEFLEIYDRETLESLLIESSSDVVEMTWRNAIRLGDWPPGLSKIEGMYTSSLDEPIYGKIALSRKYAEHHPGLLIAMGGHSVASRPCGEPAHTTKIGRLRHLPIRSISQLAGKLKAGIEACRAHQGIGQDDAFHWFEMAELLEQDALDDTAMRRVALRYGQPILEVLNDLSEPAATTQLWAPRQISLNLPCGLTDRSAAAESEAKLRWKPSLNMNDRWLMLDLSSQNAVLLPKVLDALGNPGPTRFERLREERLPEPLASGIFTPAQVTDLIDLISKPMTTPTPSAWVQHGPIMLALMALLRPRRYAELGSHCGFSFFAACQGAAEAGTNTECVAIDTWQGDHQAGNYSEEVYENFLKDLRRDHSGPHFHIRAYFDDASACFEEGSLDLLLIDGLHTLKAVSRDFENWLPKMSSRGVILFHDTTVYDHDFGVWQFWDRVSAEYPSFNFLHGHGLGMIYVGASEPALAEFLHRLAKDAERTLMVRSLLRGVGSLSAATSDLRRLLDARVREIESVRTEIMGVQPEAEGAQLTAIQNARAEAEMARAEAEMARAEAEMARAEVAAIRQSSSWRITWPMRAIARRIRRQTH